MHSARLTTPLLRGVFFGPTSAPTAEIPSGQPARRLWVGLLATGAVLLGGCASASYDIKVTAQAGIETTPARSYRIAEQSVDANHRALYQEAAKVVRHALATKGLTEAAGATEPDLVIAFTCRVGPAVTRRTMENQAIYVTIPGRIRTETVQVGAGPYGTPIVQTITIQDPPTQVVGGYREIPVDSTTATKHLRITALQNTPTPRPDQPVVAWRLEAVYDGEGQDLRTLLPVLAAASMVYLGKNSGGVATIRMRESDPDVQTIRRGP